MTAYQPIRCEFEPVEHRYTRNGLIYPSVTQIISDAGLTPDYPPGEHAARGTKLHELTAIYDNGNLDVDAWRQMDTKKDEFWQLSGYFDGYLRFLQEMKTEWTWIESAFVSLAHGYAGTVDRFGLINGQPAVLDLKTSAGAPPRTTGLQTAGYAMLILGPNARDHAARRFALHLKRTGDYRLIEYDNPADYDTFAGLTHLHRWKRSK